MKLGVAWQLLKAARLLLTNHAEDRLVQLALDDSLRRPKYRGHENLMMNRVEGLDKKEARLKLSAMDDVQVIFSDRTAVQEFFAAWVRRMGYESLDQAEPVGSGKFQAFFAGDNADTPTLRGICQTRFLAYGSWRPPTSWTTTTTTVVLAGHPTCGA